MGRQGLPVRTDALGSDESDGYNQVRLGPAGRSVVGGDRLVGLTFPDLARIELDQALHQMAALTWPARFCRRGERGRAWPLWGRDGR